MGLTMAPATESIMGSLPPEKAGVGSAVNDTTRQVGGAPRRRRPRLAVRERVHLAHRLGPQRAARRGAGCGEPGRRRGAGVAASIGQTNPQQAQTLVESAKVSFINAMDKGLIVGVIVVLVGAVISLLFLPNRAEPDEAELARIEELGRAAYRGQERPSAARVFEGGVVEEPGV